MVGRAGSTYLSNCSKHILRWHKRSKKCKALFFFGSKMLWIILRISFKESFVSQEDVWTRRWGGWGQRFIQRKAIPVNEISKWICCGRFRAITTKILSYRSSSSSLSRRMRNCFEIQLCKTLLKLILLLFWNVLKITSETITTSRLLNIYNFIYLKSFV